MGWDTKKYQSSKKIVDLAREASEKDKSFFHRPGIGLDVKIEILKIEGVNIESIYGLRNHQVIHNRMGMILDYARDYVRGFENRPCLSEHYYGAEDWAAENGPFAGA